MPSREACIEACDAAGYDAIALQGAGVTLPKLKAAGVSAKDLSSMGIAQSDLRDAGFEEGSSQRTSGEAHASTQLPPSPIFQSDFGDQSGS